MTVENAQNKIRDLTNPSPDLTQKVDEMLEKLAAQFFEKAYEFYAEELNKDENSSRSHHF